MKIESFHGRNGPSAILNARHKKRTCFARSFLQILQMAIALARDYCSLTCGLIQVLYPAIFVRIPEVRHQWHSGKILYI